MMIRRMIEALRRLVILIGIITALCAIAYIASLVYSDLRLIFIYSAFIVAIWASGTALAFQIIDLLTPMLPFREIAERNPWIIVALIGMAGGCIAYLLKSVKLAGLLG